MHMKKLSQLVIIGDRVFTRKLARCCLTELATQEDVRGWLLCVELMRKRVLSMLSAYCSYG